MFNGFMVLMVMLVVGIVDLILINWNKIEMRFIDWMNDKIKERDERRRKEICEKIKMDRWIDRVNNLKKWNNELKKLKEEMNYMIDEEDILWYEDRINYVKGMIKLYGEIRDI